MLSIVVGDESWRPWTSSRPTRSQSEDSHPPHLRQSKNSHAQHLHQSEDSHAQHLRQSEDSHPQHIHQSGASHPPPLGLVSVQSLLVVTVLDLFDKEGNPLGKKLKMNSKNNFFG